MKPIILVRTPGCTYPWMGVRLGIEYAMNVRRIKNYLRARKDGVVFEVPHPTFYAVQTVPDYLPGRIKFGYTKNPTKRLDHYLTGNPTAEILFLYLCNGKRTQESQAIKTLALLCRCRHLGSEVFDFANVDQLERKAQYIFEHSDVLSIPCDECGFPLTPPDLCPEDLRDQLEEIQNWKPQRRFDPGVCWMAPGGRRCRAEFDGGRVLF